MLNSITWFSFFFFKHVKKSVKLNVCVALNAVLIAAYDLGCRHFKLFMQYSASLLCVHACEGESVA